MTAGQLLNLVDVLRIPAIIITEHRYRFTGTEALGLLLARFRTGADQYQLQAMYGRSQSAISTIVNWLVKFLDEKWKHLLDWDYEHLLSPEKLRIYGQTLYNQGAPLDTVFGWPDCTKFFTCRPFQYQRLVYNGHSRAHCLKFQAIVIPCGIIVNLFGPIEGQRHDMTLWKESGVAENLAMHAFITDDAGVQCPYQVYGDAAYGLSPHVLIPFSGSEARTPYERAWNGIMGKNHVSVENAFAIVLMLWPFLRTWWKMKIYGSPIGQYYRVGVLLTNAVNCISPNQIAQRFDCQPPSIEEYFHD
ncbi:hypothetical protein M422DRAFT_264439 [Sphaerobolus stellatus SS14]|uniref:DDE Tnp4 domain-containing protein n=1 Tax=Sphaerobolus stellatus (strain SS14) TaxID=990650 RepID=A0A0C9TTB1_SPHS4|nr:hypothetical protein M422DRAFT_264439 [Sphaerobolus stellatus SS14]